MNKSLKMAVGRPKKFLSQNLAKKRIMRAAFLRGRCIQLQKGEGDEKNEKVTQ